MSMDLNETTEMPEERSILREITTTVNNSPSMSFLERFKTLQLNDTLEDVRSGNESLNLPDYTGQKIPKLKLNDQTLNSTLFDISGVQPPRLNGTISIDNTSFTQQEHNSILPVSEDFDKTIDVQSNQYENLSETIEEQTIQLNETTELFVSVSEEVNTEVLETSNAQHIDSEISPLNVTTDKSANLNLTCVLDEPAKTENPANCSTEKASEISQATEPSEPSKELNLTANLEKPQSSNTTFEVLNTTYNPSDISQPTFSLIDETIKCANYDLNSTCAVEEKFEELNKTAEKVEAENKPVSPCEVLDHETAAEELKDLNDTLTFPQEPASEETESCVASEEFVTPTDEIFSDPKDFDFLLSKSKSTCSEDKRLESLYVKFDPLYETRMLPQSNTIVENEDQNEMRTEDVSLPKHREASIDEQNPDDALMSSGNKRRSVAAIDHLVTMLSCDNETKEAEQNLVEDMVKELKNLKEHVLELETELEKERTERMELETKLKEMNSVVDEYEKSINRIISQAESERASLQEELRVSNQHLTNSEAAFNDVHEKYERLKGAVQVLQANEKSYKEAIQENIRTMESIETRYQVLRAHASEQLEKANVGLATSKKQHEVELLKERAKVARAELQCKSLTEMIEQKTKENRELTKILDEIIAREDNN